MKDGKHSIGQLLKGADSLGQPPGHEIDVVLDGGFLMQIVALAAHKVVEEGDDKGFPIFVQE